MENKKYARIINDVDIFGYKIIPVVQTFEIIKEAESYVALGLDNQSLYLMKKEDVEFL